MISIIVSINHSSMSLKRLTRRRERVYLYYALELGRLPGASRR